MCSRRRPRTWSSIASLPELSSLDGRECEVSTAILGSLPGITVTAASFIHFYKHTDRFAWRLGFAWFDMILTFKVSTTDEPLSSTFAVLHIWVIFGWYLGDIWAMLRGVQTLFLLRFFFALNSGYFNKRPLVCHVKMVSVDLFGRSTGEFREFQLEVLLAKVIISCTMCTRTALRSNRTTLPGAL